MYFDIYFSTAKGLIIDLPFLDLRLPAYACAIILFSIVALRVRKVLRDRKRANVNETVKSDFESDPFWNEDF